MMYFKDSAVGVVLLVIGFGFWINVESSEAHGVFGFDIHHRYSDTVKEFIDLDGLPEKGSLDYYAAMAHRDHLSKSRRLATTPASSPFLTFFGSNATYRLSSLGFLHYSIVSVGTPAVTFLVALDTGSDLFWLPCQCANCARTWNSTSRSMPLNMYSPVNSSTSTLVPCNSTSCGARRQCSVRLDACAYQEVYLSSNTSSTGVLVDDVLHLGTDTTPQSLVNAPITLGCGIVQTGDFLDGAAINGLFGLGMDEVSVPSTLAAKGLAANSFSMCFGSDGIGRIEFGDKGSPTQKVTPINVEQRHPTYNVTVTQIALERNVTDIEFTVIFDSGTSFTYLNDPSYSIITDGFNAQVTEPRYQPPRIIFDYCYELGANQQSYLVPDLNFTMKGGQHFFINAPTIVIPRQGGGFAYCLAIVKSEDIDIIGQNFMTGYRLTFDRDEMVLGWEESTCYDSISGSNTLPINKTGPAVAPSPSILNPEATPGNTSRPPFSSRLPPPLPTTPTASLPGSDAASLNIMTSTLLMVLVSILFHFIILSS